MTLSATRTRPANQLVAGKAKPLFSFLFGRLGGGVKGLETRDSSENGGLGVGSRGAFGLEVEARARNKPVLGARAVRAQHPHTRPEHLERSPRPLGHASTRQALREVREQYRTFVAAFREAAARWGRGDFAAPFPPFSFPPRVVPGCVA